MIKHLNVNSCLVFALLPVFDEVLDFPWKGGQFYAVYLVQILPSVL